MSTQVSVYNVRDRISPYGHTTFHILDKSGAFQEEAEITRPNSWAKQVREIEWGH